MDAFLRKGFYTIGGLKSNRILFPYEAKLSACELAKKLLDKVPYQAIVVGAYFRQALFGEKQEVCVAVNRNGGFLSPVLQHPFQRLIDLLAHGDFSVAAFSFGASM